MRFRSNEKSLSSTPSHRMRSTLPLFVATIICDTLMQQIHVTGTYNGISNVWKNNFIVKFVYHSVNTSYVPSLALRQEWLPLQKVQRYHVVDFGTEDRFDCRFLWDCPRRLTNTTVTFHRLSAIDEFRGL